MGAIGAMVATGAVAAISAPSTGSSPLVAFCGQSIHVSLYSIWRLEFEFGSYLERYARLLRIDSRSCQLC